MGKNILASSSPRRAEILKDKYVFEIMPSPYEEIHATTVFSYDYVENLAYNKAKAVVPLVEGDCNIIGADTVVVLDGKILEKPQDSEDAKQMLKSLSGREHQVVTKVIFNDLTDAMIDFYVNNFKPLDKAGAYGIQELPEGYVKSYSGSLENIIGICPKALDECFQRLLFEENTLK